MSRYATFETDHTAHEEQCGCHPETKAQRKRTELRNAFERYIMLDYCGHLRHDEDTFNRTVTALLKRSAVKGYEDDYFHQHIHYEWRGFQAAQIGKES
jgi:hypothetical protein